MSTSKSVPSASLYAKECAEGMEDKVVEALGRILSSLRGLRGPNQCKGLG